MTAEVKQVRAALRLAPGVQLTVEPEGESSDAPLRIEAGGKSYAARRYRDPELAANHAAVAEALLRAGFEAMPRPVGFAGELLIEALPEAVALLAVAPPPGALEAAVAALAQLHALPLREGLRQGSDAANLLPDELPLFRLGFTAEEREAAREPLNAARAELLAKGAFGFGHGAATADAWLVAPGKAWLTGWGHAGLTHQLDDVAALLLTSGAGAGERARLAEFYAGLRGQDAFVSLLDLAGLTWALSWQMLLPRRLVEALGDDSRTDALHLMAARIERALREPALEHPLARAIRDALWPDRR